MDLPGTAETLRRPLTTQLSFKSLDQHLRSIQAADVGVSHAEGKGKSTAAGGKKRKADTQTSRGVQKLQKTDTSKMNKLTSFFQKKSTA
ncbi:hypothetical protein FRC14_000515 [Serendipita sp. 396]|nr:hypothetical protein FRC14_000515 [Serendipita sp. 396]